MEIQDYPNYLIFDDGRVFSKKRKTDKKTFKNRGYEQITLSKNGKTKTTKIHRLVAIHYIPKIEGKDYVDHIDGNKSNNNVNNLRWTTNIENCNNYKSISKNNKLGFKNIIKSRYGFEFKKRIYEKTYTKKHKNLNELHWYKFTFLLINQISL